MNTSMLALLGFAAWTLLLLGAIAAIRTTLTVTGRKRANSFLPSGDDVSPFSARLCRAHANCYENLPIFAALILVAHATNNAHITSSLALWVLAARIGQSTLHLVSTRNRAVRGRFLCFAVQVLIEAWWAVRLFAALL